MSKYVPFAETMDLVVQSKEPCVLCGELAALNPHKICEAKVKSLELLARARRRGGDGWCRCEAGRGLRIEATGQWIHAPYRLGAHATYLVWYGLVERREPREGVYRIVPDGLRFLRGDLDVPKRILCRKGVTRYASIERVFVHEVKNVVLDKAYWDNYPWSEFLDD